MAVHEVESDADELVRAGAGAGREEGERDGAERSSACSTTSSRASGCRRTLDGAASCASPEAARRTIARRLAELRQAVERILDRARAASPHRHGAGRSRQGVAGRGPGRPAKHPDRVRSRPSGARPGVEGLRGDLEWLGVLVARLDREPPPTPDRVPRSRARAGSQRRWARRADAVEPELAGGLERLRAPVRADARVLLERRVRRELAAPTAGAAQSGSWRIGSSSPGCRRGWLRWSRWRTTRRTPRWLGGDPGGVGESLAIRRIELADGPRIRAPGAWSLTDAQRPCERSRPGGQRRDQRDHRLPRGHAPAPGREAARAGRARTWTSCPLTLRRLLILRTSTRTPDEPTPREELAG